MNRSKNLWLSVLKSPTLFVGATLLISSSAVAATEEALPEETISQESAVNPTTTVEALTVEALPDVTSLTQSVLPSDLPLVADASTGDTVELSNSTINNSIISNSTIGNSASDSVTSYGDEETAEDDLMGPVTGVSQLSGQTVEDDSMEQVTNVSQLRDVSPGDWAYEALRSLVERYGCIAGYPNATFRGNRALTRYEFAAGLNSCLNQIERLLGGVTGDFITREDLESLQRLVQEFETELATLGARVDNLEGRVAFLEDHQFSTTTKLKGEVIFALADAFGGDADDVQTVFHNRTRLNFLTSFTGKDMLQTRLQAGDAPTLITGAGGELAGTQEGRFTYDGPSGNDVIIDILRYRFPLGDKVTVQLLANRALHHYYADTVNPFFEGRAGGSNAITRFAERNPIYRIGPFGAGAALAIKPIKDVRIDLGYISNTASNPQEGQGLFNGNFSAIAQLVYGSDFKVGFTYIRGYEDNADGRPRLILGGTGTALANLNPAALGNATSLGTVDFDSAKVESNSFGVQTSLRLTPNIVLNGWAGYTDAELIGLGDAEIWNFAAGIAFPDLGKKGNLAGIFGGAAPTLRGLDLDDGNSNFDNDFAYQVSAFYKYKLNNNISVTPGVVWLLNPNQSSDNDDVVIGTLRTTFTF
ncbi:MULTISPECIES: iron uptake porin [Moorena]|uniref:iron uptake porin n=1 Tax=Moorena TaxID=1155738 RepID=UPI001E42682B|nr:MULTISPECIES: iron uptake porin [Moorena]